MRKLILLAMSILLLIGILAGCGSNSQEVIAEKTEKTQIQEKSVLKVAVPDGVTALSMIKMIKEKPELGEEVEVSYEIVKSPDLMASKVISQEADIAVVPTNLAAMLYSKNVPYKLAASTVWGVLYVVGTEEVKSWEDLKGKEIYNMGRGLTPDVIFRYLLEKNGLNPEKDVVLHYLSSGQELAQSLISGKNSLSVIPEPVGSQVLLQKQDAKVLLDLQAEWEKASGINASYPQASLLISNNLSDKHSQVVDNFLKELELSIQWINQNPGQAGAYAEELQTGMKAKVVETGLVRSNIRYVGAKEARSAIEEYLKVLMDFSPETIGGKLPDESFYLAK
ncbi:ABC-type nitrate/sulfonate/bicarbonate transport system, periplasmic component [Desulfosporosinus youngiae DSM 17734]|uniref:ABC-type nitrate/sulfonate/bicarbonate transport system, periplasmic component n=2 Tax=Desulfosporosinus TaxID=79206 RepID=H5Y4P5_9FIRM|nr:ABC-type nitrate/sulfonate/bicarbonate transport system, periplasmic component [Desulfosporosinus youngiae DSM 17734]